MKPTYVASRFRAVQKTRPRHNTFVGESGPELVSITPVNTTFTTFTAEQIKVFLANVKKHGPI